MTVGLFGGNRGTFQVGDQVRIVAGAFADIEGDVNEVDPKHKKLSVLITVSDKDAIVELEFKQVEKM